MMSYEVSHLRMLMNDNIVESGTENFCNMIVDSFS